MDVAGLAIRWIDGDDDGVTMIVCCTRPAPSRPRSLSSPSLIVDVEPVEPCEWCPDSSSGFRSATSVSVGPLSPKALGFRARAARVVSSGEPSFALGIGRGLDAGAAVELVEIVLARAVLPLAAGGTVEFVDAVRVRKLAVLVLVLTKPPALDLPFTIRFVVILDPASVLAPSAPVLFVNPLVLAAAEEIVLTEAAELGLLGTGTGCGARIAAATAPVRAVALVVRSLSGGLMPTSPRVQWIFCER